LAFAYVERSVVIDHHNRCAYVQSIAGNDDNDEEALWISSTISLLQTITESSFTPAPTPPARSPVYESKRASSGGVPLKIEPPNQEQYIRKIISAQEYLKAGDSYEICLTALTRVTAPSPIESTASIVEPRAWRLFKALRALNPAPYGAYLRLAGTTLVGSSPERFLSWSRDGLCQLRPIKGTVKKSSAGHLDVTFVEAEAQLLGSPKEIAENLMIVDLIRHDLSRVVSASAARGSADSSSSAHNGDVNVTKLFVVEEYETVFQLVSVIEGRVDMERGYSGWDVLARSLPPGIRFSWLSESDQLLKVLYITGSMTGAPKKRSVELLQSLESKSAPGVSSTDEENATERGVYSGVLGYWCVGGGGDFSVIIRSAFRYDDETISGSFDPNGGSETWYLGAGGAITALSDPQEEWEEMRTKLSSTLRAFMHL
jgi:para-aminobenzoate synthetase